MPFWISNFKEGNPVTSSLIFLSTVAVYTFRYATKVYAGNI
ncbi:hypothetical protein BofuT4_uP060390.1 [Botrytis cinerea T4]|uniref:Uncharacterized protein n=1 Tax=Botryotinia fuckeliana (strain T4) TaxID=999810 RepID=G2XUF0_BOTF4|nr:hypothetical protein BofuT4_uP060390.1 [Botrytis cinerea T4]